MFGVQIAIRAATNVWSMKHVLIPVGLLIAFGYMDMEEKSYGQERVTL